MYEDCHVGLVQDGIKAAVMAVPAADPEHFRRAIEAIYLMACLKERDEDPARSGGRFQDPSADFCEEAHVVLHVPEGAPDGLVEVVRLGSQHAVIHAHHALPSSQITTASDLFYSCCFPLPSRSLLWRSGAAAFIHGRRMR